MRSNSFGVKKDEIPKNKPFALFSFPSKAVFGFRRKEDRSSLEMFQTIKEKKNYESRLILDSGLLTPPYGYYKYSLSPDCTIEELEVFRDPTCGTDVDVHFFEIKQGIEEIYPYYKTKYAFRICSVRVDILSVKVHPNAPTAWKLNGRHVIDPFIPEYSSALISPLVINPNWRTTNVLELADGIHSDKAYDRMPILADALQEAGCDDEMILSHCRLCKDHQGKCWVVDLILNQL
jgi:hypothetical protein